MTIEERLNKIEQFFKGKDSKKNKDGVFNIVTGQRMLPVAGAAADSTELLTKDDFCNAFVYTALTKGMPDFDNFESPAIGMDKIIDYSKKALAKCLLMKQDEAVICECGGGQEYQAYPKYAFNLFGPSSGFVKDFGLTADKSMDICLQLFYLNEYFEEGMKLHPAAVRESVKSGLSKQLKIFAEYVVQRETPDAEYVNSIQKIKNNASVAMRNRINGEQTKNIGEESIVSKSLSELLKGEAVFLGMMEGVEGWARIIWKKNPQLLDFYKTGRLASVASKLQNYGSNENLRFIWAKVGVPVDFFNGQDFEWRIVKVESCDELKKALMESVRSFIPDANNMSPAMEMWFLNAGNHWMGNGVPERWQDLNEYCINPEYDCSLFWDNV